jgi:putative ABC transport system permease protein
MTTWTKVGLAVRAVAIAAGLYYANQPAPVPALAAIAASLWASTFVGTMMYGLAPRDSATLVGAVVVLVGAAFLAAWLPARRAARLDPMSVVRSN